MIRFAKYLVPVVVLYGCAASIGTPSLELEDEADFKRRTVGAIGGVGSAAFRSGKVNGQVQWFSCQGTQAKQTALLINGDNEIFDTQFCRSWVAQTFLAAGLSVVGVNRPGYGKSRPGQDFGGPVSVAAVDAAVKNAAVKYKWFDGRPVGVWGVQSGSIVAAAWAKAHSGTQWLILGNGIFDLEEFRSSTKSKTYQQMIQAAQGSESNDDFNEQRSIAWDTKGLPNRILLYHGSSDHVISASHSASFRDTLAAEEYAVKLEVIPDSGHDFKPIRHRQVLEAMLKQLAPVDD
jgi:dipeptidyl aminopeptidase/acylaminoacyl peptidase